MRWKNAFLIGLAFLLSAGTGCNTPTNQKHTQTKNTTYLSNHPRSYPQQDLMNTAIKAMRIVEIQENTKFVDSLENYMTQTVKTDTQAVHTNYFPDYRAFYVDFGKGVMQNTPKNMSSIGPYMITKEVRIYAATGQSHTCVYDLFYMIISKQYKNVRLTDIKYANVDGGRPSSCLSYDYSR
mgnify:CR=1 FL=1